MGMYDDLTLFETDARVSCAAGHPVRELQTKSLDSNMDHYYILDGRLYVVARDRDEEVVLKTRRGTNDVYRVYEARMERTDLTKTITAYNPCRECTPVFTLSDMSHFMSNSRLEENHPWTELEIKFVKGQLKSVTKTKCETRDQLRAKLARGGSALLADDEPEVIAYLKKGK